MIDFVEYVIGELKSKRLSRSDAVALMEQFSRRSSVSEDASRIHPLLHRNTSDLTRQSYQTSFTGEEFFLRDHQVHAKRVLPGVAYLEMARAAVINAQPVREAGTALELRNVIWAQPLVVTEPREIALALYVNEEARVGGEKVEFEIFSREESQTALEVEHGEARYIIHCRGQTVFTRAQAPPRCDLESLQSQMLKGRLEADNLYPLIAKVGITIGPAHQGVKTVYQGERQQLARVCLPDVVSNTCDEYVLHPSVMDSVLQASTALIVDMSRHANQPPVPFALECLQIFSACKPEMFAWARHCTGRADDKAPKLDIDLYDTEGNLCVRMLGFSSRALRVDVSMVGTQGARTGRVLAAPVWETCTAHAVSPGDDAQQHVILCNLPNVDVGRLEALLGKGREPGSCLALNTIQPTVADRYSEVALACFAKVKALLQGGVQRRALVQVVVADDPDTTMAGVSGLLKSAARENPRLAGQVIITNAQITAPDLAALLEEMSHQAHEPMLKCVRGEPQVLRWRIIEDERDTRQCEPRCAFKEGGVYLITGGLGGLGVVFAKEILRKTREARVILTGRHALTTARKAMLDELCANSGQRALYRQVDLGDAQQVKRLISSLMRELGRLDGIIHSAGMIADAFILKKTPEQVSCVLEPKVAGTFNLDEASHDIELDFMVLFSAGAAVFGNAGQGDYAAANGFMDQFAYYRNHLVSEKRRQGLTLAINWPLWQEGGMAMDAASRQMLQRTTGMHPMKTAIGLQAFHECVELGRSQLLVVEGDLQEIRRVLQEPGAARSVAPALVPQREPARTVADSATLVERTQSYLRKQFSMVLKLAPQEIDPSAPLEKYGIDSILAMELTAQLEQSFGSLPKTLFFEYRSIRELTQYFTKSHVQQLISLGVGGSDGAARASEGPFEISSALRQRALPSNGLRRGRLHAATTTGPSRTSEPIAIVGLSGRYPQAANIEEYWQNLRAGRDCIVEVPRQRWDWREYYRQGRTAEGCHYSKWGGFIDGVDEFDPLFFNISPVDAEGMDPQERLFLQHAWMALEDAGYTRASLQLAHEEGQAGQVGVYVGVMYGEYQLFGAEASLRGKRMGLPVSYGSIANRVSYFLDLHGPSMALDTMCSSSLTALHLACEDLKRGRTSAAIAGGVNVTIHPNKYLMLSAGQFISSDGRCQSFGQGGDGYIPGEGVGVVVLKRLAEAERDGNHIYGVIKGSALNHGGRTNGYSVPNPQAQASVISQALREHGIEPRHISYVEAHGTGTRLGDPIEIAALTRVFRQSTEENQFCRIGSAKSNIGHCESAAGIAGLTKVLLQMKHRLLVPSLHSAVLNPHIDFKNTPFVVNQTLQDWQPEVDGRRLPRIAGISSFGAGGSNAHLIVEEYPGPEQAAARLRSASAPSPQVAVTLSARTPEQLKHRARDLLAFIRKQERNLDLSSMAYSLQVGREAMEERFGVLASSAEQLLERLQAYVDGEEGIEDAYQGQVRRHKEALAVFGNDADLQETIDKWIAGRKLSRLLELWAKGLEIDWNKLYGELRPRLMSLPTYPFARERYWVDTASGGQFAGQSAPPVLHPLLHTNTSDFSRQSYRSSFTGGEFFLADHRVALEEGAPQIVLPGVAYLEMARAALEDARPMGSESAMLELRNVVWAQPYVFTDERRPVSIALLADGEQQIDFEIYSEGDTGAVVHCQGLAAFNIQPALERLDVEQLRGQMKRGALLAESVYATYARMGLEYGPGHRAIIALQRGDQQLLAQLRIPAALESGQAQYWLHPSLMDGALQAAIGLLELSTDFSTRPRVPFALESLTLLSACTTQMLAWVRYAPGSGPQDKLMKLYIDLCDEQGRVCVQMRGFSSRTAGKEGVAVAGAAKPTGTLLVAPMWQSAAPPSAVHGSQQLHEYVERHIILCELAGVDGRQLETLISRSHCVQLQALPQETLAERYCQYALACFERLQAVLAGGPHGQVLVQIVVPGSHERAVFAGLTGLLRTAALENPQLVGQIILTSPAIMTGELARQLQEDQRSPHNLLKHEGDTLQVLHWQELQATQTPVPMALKDRGVYLITGGLGGLGIVFAKEILRQTPNARIILSGRSSLDSHKRAILETLRAASGQVDYRRLDLGSLEQVEQLLASIKGEYAQLNGILHSAGMIADNFILKKPAAEFGRVLAPKVIGTFNLDHATRAEDLDFFVLFSSVTGALGNPGQADYAAANGFMDHFAAYRNRLVNSGRRQGRTLSINWPLWLEGGMAIDSLGWEQLRQAIGLMPMSTASGLQAFYRGLQSADSQMLVLEGDLEQLRALLATRGQGLSAAANATAATARIPAQPTARASPSQTTAAANEEGLLQKLQDFLRSQFSMLLKLPQHRIDPQVALEEYGIDSVLAMKLTNVLEQIFGSLSKTLFFEYQTIAALSAHLLKAYPDIVRNVIGVEQPAAQTPKSQTTPLAQKHRPAMRHRARNRILEETNPARREVAIVGVSGRYPQAEDLQQFWENLKSGRDCITEIPTERWNHELYYDPDYEKRGKTYSKWGGFIADVDKFDPLFFNISPNEAEIIDPQERLFLETAWHTIEDAGYSKESIWGQRIGVFVGVMWSQYELYGAAGLSTDNPVVPSSSHASVANRVSYFFNFQGPSLALDTMCSSSLTAIHLASEAIRRGEIDAALAGGVNLSVHPQKYLSLSQGKFAASDGRCRSFGQGGDGYVPGEGVGAIFLKALDEALRDGDQIYALIKASSINHGGKTNGYTVPNPNAQGGLILETLKKAGIDPRTLGYIETHGTGTSLGDPIEISGLQQAFAAFTQERQFCPIGSVKSNIGHLEAAAGIAAVTKALLQIKHGQLVPSLHAQPANPHIRFEESPFYVQTRLADWQCPAGQPRRIAVSSFGAGGSNAHLILEGHGASTQPQSSLQPTRPEVFLLSARDPEALSRYVAKVLKFLERDCCESLADLAYTSQVGRTTMPARLAVIAANMGELKEKLESWAVRGNGAAGGLAEPEGVFYGNVKDAQYSAAELLQGAAGKAFLQDLLVSRELGKVARLWTLGAAVDWSVAPKEAHPRRVSLPTYPFARQRCWINAGPAFAHSSQSGEQSRSKGGSPHAVRKAAVHTEEKRRIYYRPQWTATSLRSTGQGQAASEPILVLDTTDELFQAIRARLGEGLADSPVVLARLGRSYQEVAPEIFTIDHEREGDFQRLVESLKARGQLPRLILHRSSRIDSLGQREHVAQQLNHGVYTLLHLCKALMRQKQHAPRRIVSLFSRNAHTPAPLSAALGGFLRTLSLENPKYVCKLLEIESQAGGREVSVEEEAGIVLDEIRDERWFTSELRYRCALYAQSETHTRYLKEYVPYRPEESGSPELPLKERGVYIITGGLGGLGAIFAEYLARNFRAKLVLVGRSAPDAAQARKIDRLKAHGGDVVHLRGDVAQFADMESVVQQSKARFGCIHGVIHSAGVTRDSFALRKTREEMATVLDPKVHGAVNLDRATLEEQLDLFVLCSSVAGALGNLGQCDYAYGNHFLDSFAQAREALRLAGKRSGRTLAINWPFWEEGGMRLSQEVIALTARRTGLHPLPTEEGLRCWEDLLRSDLLQGVALYGTPGRIAAHIAGRATQAEVGTVAEPEVADVAALLARTEAYLKSLVGEEIKLAPERIDSRARFESLGLESVVITRCNAKLERDLGALPKTLLYEYETVGELAKYLMQEARPALIGLFDAAGTPAELDLVTAESHADENADPTIQSEQEPEQFAIVGVHGRYPQCRNVEELWSNLSQGKDLIGLVPQDRWDCEELFEADPGAAAQGRIYCKWGGFLEDYDKFDAPFFGIPAGEARIIDPQERLFLQSVWAALEDAGYTPQSLKDRFPKGKGADVGVFVGVTTNSYHLLAAEERASGNHASAAALPWSIANRVSYFFDWRGPSLPVDTACSSSLVAIHMACESLRNRQCQVALAGGVNLYLHASKYLSLCQRRMLASGGRTRSYGAGDDGFVPGEGVGTLVLKRLQQAVQDKDRIYAVISASAFEHSGRSNGYSAPNPNAQASLVEMALNRAHIHPQTISYVEGHGTGTQLGDSLEVAALTQAFGKQAASKQYCALGSVKANIGHSESAAGIAGVTKVILQLQHRQLVPSIHSVEVNPDIEFERSPFRLQHELGAWEPAQGAPRRALVNSFGAGGVNACLVLEEYTDANAPQALRVVVPCLFTLSAKSAERLRVYVGELIDFLRKDPALDLATLCYTLQTGREAMEERLALLVTDVEELIARLEDWTQGKTSAHVHQGRCGPGRGRAALQQVSGPSAAVAELTRLARGWVLGEEVDWESLYAAEKPRRLALPTYPFERQRHWISDARPHQHTQRVSQAEPGLHPLVSFNSSTLREVCFNSLLSNDAFYAIDHQVAGESVLPGAAFLEMAYVCGCVAGERRVCRIADVVWVQPLSFRRGPQSLRTFLKHIGEGAEFAITSLGENGERVIHCEGRLFFGQHAAEPEEGISLRTLLEQLAECRDGHLHYEEARKRGLRYGAAFRTIQEIRTNASSALSRLQIAEHLQADAGQFVLHPSLIDGALQTVGILLGRVEPDVPCLPFALDEVEIIRPVPCKCYAHVEIAAQGQPARAGIRKFNIQLLNERGDVLVRLKQLHVRAHGKAQAIQTHR